MPASPACSCWLAQSSIRWSSAPTSNRSASRRRGLGAIGVVQWHVRDRGRGGTLAALGVELVGYLPNHAFQVRWSAESRARLEAHPAVRWLSDYPPGLKVSPALWPGRTLEPDARINVVGFRRADLAEVEASLLAELQGPQRTSRSRLRPSHRYRFHAPAEVVRPSFPLGLAARRGPAWLAAL